MKRESANETEDDVNDNQQRPNHHYVLDTQSICIEPAPDKSIETANQTKNAVQRSLILEQFNKHHDEANDAAEPYYQSEYSQHSVFLRLTSCAKQFLLN